MGKREEHKRTKKPRHVVHSPHATNTTTGTASPAATPTPVPKEDSAYDAEIIDIVDVVDHEQEVSSTPTPTTPVLTPPKACKSSSSGGKKSTTKQPSTPAASSNSSPAASATPTASGYSANNKKSKKRRDSSTSSEEERWLTAIESGKLEEMDDELKKMKDPKLMTARQRAMYERNTDKEPSPGGELLMSLPTGYREKEKPQTAEDIQKAQLKSQKRKQLADEKREKDKKKTMDRLLKKQESKQRNATRNKSSKVSQPMITYHNTLDGAYIQLPTGHEFPLAAQKARAPPKVQICGIAGCGKPKVYNCSKTNLPLCSFACYRKNVQNIRQIMC
ncbi:PREDICTED: INO80 complex subunit B [Rhagoletis zephyria]|uniref:INO80 complex subunit B n=1 Tax=Rhagoletis zephyria TaxID=28612 RepID=UPI00081159ED|nr:PREDICTED: INO80 complex subunit B [Rhagoletis zephyria]